MANKKHSKNDGVLVIGALMLAPFFWLYEKLGGIIFWVLIISCIGGFIFYFYKKKKELNEKQHPVIHVRASTPAKNKLETYSSLESICSQQKFAKESIKFYKKFANECWRTIDAPSPHPSIDQTNGLYFMQHSFNQGHAEIVRSLQIIRNSIDIVMQSKNEKTITSRMQVIEQCYKHLQESQYLFKNIRDYDRVHERFSELIQQIHATVYLNIAQGHADKMDTVKTDKTKAKYLALAIEALELGLNDPEAPQEVLMGQIEVFKTHELYNLVQNKM